jgi:hypothetical protein
MRNDPMTKRPSREIKAAITLYGDADTGKTATLRYLYYLLTGKNPPGQYIDFREAFDYVKTASGKQVIIALSTVGDEEDEVELNWVFFRGKWNKDFKQTGLKRYLRSCEDYASDDGVVIVISPTHINDAGSRVNDTNIANLKESLSHILYIKKKIPFKIVSPVDADTWEILTNSPQPKAGWSDVMARNAIRTAESIKEQIELIIGQL